MDVFFNLDSLPKFQNAVVTIGSFDGVHEGHRRILERLVGLAAEVGGESAVITFEPHPRQVLRPDDSDFRLLSTIDEKVRFLKETGISAVVFVPFSLEFAEITAEDYIENFLVKWFSPRKIVIGYDHKFGKGRAGDLLFLKKFEAKHGFEVIEIPKHEEAEIAVSSTKIRRSIESADIATANLLLGHPYRLTGEVVEGDKIGRTIGFPTANLLISEKVKLIPPPGIYAARTELPDGQKVDSMLYIGSRPTIQLVEDQRVEVSLLNFDGDLYGQKLSVEIIDFIRFDKKLDGLDALKKQIEEDKMAIEKRLVKQSEPEFERVENPQSAIPNPQSPSVAVVILNYNTRHHLEEFLPSVLKTDYPDLRVIVCDNASPDDSVSFMKNHYPNVQVIENQRNSGFAGGYNEALHGLAADYYVLLNSDVEVSENWILPIIERMEKEQNVAIAQPKILALRDKNRFEYAGAAGGWIDFLGYPFCRGRIFQESEIDAGQYDEPQDCFWAAGAAMFIRSKIWHRFGGFDADYFAHNEEIDLCWRVKRAGWRVICEPRSVVFHLGGGTLEYENPRKVFLNFRNSLFSILKNESAARLIWLLPARLLLDGAAAGMFFVKGKFSSILAILRAHFSFYGQFFHTLEKRKKVAQLVADHTKICVGPFNRAGILSKSIVWQFYLKRVRRFSDLFETGKIHP